PWFTKPRRLSAASRPLPWRTRNSPKRRTPSERLRDPHFVRRLSRGGKQAYCRRNERLNRALPRRRSSRVSVDVDHGLGERFRSFLRNVVADALQHAVRV